MIQILKIRKRSNLDYDVKPNIVALGRFNSVSRNYLVVVCV